MPEPAPRPSQPLSKLLSKTLKPSRALSATLDTVTVGLEGNLNTVYVDSMTLAPFNVQDNDETDQEREMQNAINRRNEYKTKENACIIAESPLQYKATYLGYAKRRNISSDGVAMDQRQIL